MTVDTILFSRTSQWQDHRKTLTGSLGFVPTMGALHEGHLSLVKKSKSENDHTLVSIFVNPTQFNDPADLDQYPRTLEKDMELLKSAGVDFVLSPTALDMYPDHFSYRVEEAEISKELCGAFRPGHFTGMLTVVLKLLNLAQANRAYFGEKDFQQLMLVKGMVQAFFIPTQIIPCPSIRESSGLAMSSRNTRLAPEFREKASHLYAILQKHSDLKEAVSDLKQNDFEVEYVEEKWNRRLAAVKLGGVRLIDNVDLSKQ